MSDARSTPLYCPYCGEEDLFPHEASHGAWECHACARFFSVKFNGLLTRSFHIKNGNSSEEGVHR